MGNGVQRYDSCNPVSDDDDTLRIGGTMDHQQQDTPSSGAEQRAKQGDETLSTYIYTVICNLVTRSENPVEILEIVKLVSANPQNGSSGSDKNYSELEPKPKATTNVRGEAPATPSNSPYVPASAPPLNI